MLFEIVDGIFQMTIYKMTSNIIACIVKLNEQKWQNLNLVDKHDNLPDL